MPCEKWNRNVKGDKYRNSIGRMLAIIFVANRQTVETDKETSDRPMCQPTICGESLRQQRSVSGVINPAITGETALQQGPPTRELRPPETEKLSISLVDNLAVNFSEKFEYEQDASCCTVKGSLKANIQFWRDINSNDYILDVIENGYCIPFVDTPVSSYLGNNKSARDNQEFVSKAILDLLSTGAIVEKSHVPYVVNPLTVASNKEKKRLVIDLRYVNPNIWHDKLKFEEWKVALEYLNPGDYTSNFDLKSGYHHVDVNIDYQKFLGFAWDFGHGTRFFEFTVLPFGLSTAGYIFTKVLRCMVKHWRELGIKIILYLDDGLIIGSDRLKCLKATKIVRRDLKKAGLIAQESKSNWEPAQQSEWLGVALDTSRFILYIPQHKINNIISMLQVLIKRGSASARILATITGKVMSTNIVCGSVTKLMTKWCHMAIMSRMTWDSYFVLDTNVLAELNFWQANLSKLNIRNLRMSHEVNRVVFSDASNSGCGGYVVDVRGSVCYRGWVSGEDTKSSTWREIMGVFSVLESLTHLFKDKIIKWYSDNQNVIRIIENGSMKSELQELALKIYHYCLLNNITLHMEWVPRG